MFLIPILMKASGEIGWEDAVAKLVAQIVKSSPV
jgi:hypothetical protein